MSSLPSTLQSHEPRYVVRRFLSFEGSIPADLIATLSSACDELEDSDKAGVLVIQISGVGACREAGSRAVPAVQSLNQWERVLRRVERLNALTLALVNGTCDGLAFASMLACDYRIATRGTCLSLSTDYGLLPSMAIHRLANQIGAGRARGLVLHGARLKAAEAQTLGILDEVTEDLQGACEALLDGCLASSTTDISIRRRLLLEAASTTYEEALGAHLAATDRALRAAVDRDRAGEHRHPQ